jgi:hypothetical protein
LRSKSRRRGEQSRLWQMRHIGMIYADDISKISENNYGIGDLLALATQIPSQWPASQDPS